MADITLGCDREALFILEGELRRRNTYFWKTATGELIRVKDMSDSHLKNTIRKLENYIAEQEIFKDCYGDVFPY